MVSPALPCLSLRTKLTPSSIAESRSELLALPLPLPASALPPRELTSIQQKSLYWHFPSDALASLTTRHTALTRSVTDLRSKLAQELEVVGQEEAIREGGVSFFLHQLCVGVDERRADERGERAGREGGEVAEVGEGQGALAWVEGGGGAVGRL